MYIILSNNNNSSLICIIYCSLKIKCNKEYIQLGL